MIILDDGFFLPVFEPEVPWNPMIMLINLAVATLPVVKLAGGYA
jgi:hypothetical protein